MRAMNGHHMTNLFNSYVEWLRRTESSVAPTNHVMTRPRDIINLREMANESLCNELSGIDLRGYPALVTGSLYCESLTEDGSNADIRVRNEPLIFAGITIERLRGQDRPMLRFFNLPCDNNDNASYYFYADPRGLERVEVALLPESLEKKAETCRSYTLNYDFYGLSAEEQLEVLEMHVEKFAEGLPQGPCKIDAQSHIKFYYGDAEEGIVVSNEPSRLLGVMLEPVFAELLTSDNLHREMDRLINAPMEEKLFHEIIDFPFGGGAPCLFLRDISYPQTFYAVPVDSVHSIHMINVNDPSSWQSTLGKKQKY